MERRALELLFFVGVAFLCDWRYNEDNEFELVFVGWWDANVLAVRWNCEGMHLLSGWMITAVWVWVRSLEELLSYVSTKVWWIDRHIKYSRYQYYYDHILNCCTVAGHHCIRYVCCCNRQRHQNFKIARLISYRANSSLDCKDAGSIDYIHLRNRSEGKVLYGSVTAPVLITTGGLFRNVVKYRKHTQVVVVVVVVKMSWVPLVVIAYLSRIFVSMSWVRSYRYV